MFHTLLHITLITADKIFRKFRLKDYALSAALALTAFGTGIIILSGMINNDMLSVMFIFLCILYTFRWHKEPSLKNMLKIALFFGLGMMSKMSVSLIAPSIAVIFLYDLFKPLKNKNYGQFKKYFCQMVAFVGVAAPLSLYWSLRNLIRFGLPLGYVPLSEDASLYIPNDIMTRIFDFRPYQLANPYFNVIEYGDIFNEYNPLIALIKSSASDVGIIRFSIGMFPGYATLYTTLLVSVVAFILMIYIICKKNTLCGVYKIFWIVTYAVYLISYEYFCIKYPHTCTEQIRYAMPIILVGAVFIGLGLKKLFEQKSLIYRTFGYLTVVSVGIFSLTSIAIFIYCGIVQTVQMMM